MFQRTRRRAWRAERRAASVDFLMYSGYVLLGYYWLRLALTAEQKLAEGGDANFCKGKLKTANFYFARILPRTLTLAATIRAGAPSLMDLADDEF